ncbi:MAG: hypothetical protein ACK526_14730 [Planctomyces sp.]
MNIAERLSLRTAEFCGAGCRVACLQWTLVLISVGSFSCLLATTVSAQDAAVLDQPFLEAATEAPLEGSVPSIGDAAAEAPLSDSIREDPAGWKHLTRLSVPADLQGTGVEPVIADGSQNADSLCEFYLTPELFTNCREDLSDLRLFDDSGKTIPYALRVLAPKSIQESVPASEFNRSESDADVSELTLELSGDSIRHNEVRIVSDGENFRRAVIVDGSDEGTEWRRLGAGYLVRLADGPRLFEVDRISWSESRFRFVRIQVHPDRDTPPEASSAEEKIRTDDAGSRPSFIRDATVMRQISLPGVPVTRDAVLSEREPGRINGTAGSSWIIDLGGDRIPVDRIEVEVSNREFYRDVDLEVERVSGFTGQKYFESVGIHEERQWQRSSGQGSVPFVMTFPEVVTSRLRLRVTDYQNVPLSIQKVRYSAPARQVVFSADPEKVNTIAVYTGSPNAESPMYDFARNLPEEIQPKRTVTPGSTEPNPSYVAPPVPFSERFPWLIYVVFGTVSLVLAAVMMSLARSAIALHDAAIAAATAAVERPPEGLPS